MAARLASMKHGKTARNKYLAIPMLHSRAFVSARMQNNFFRLVRGKSFSAKLRNGKIPNVNIP